MNVAELLSAQLFAIAGQPVTVVEAIGFVTGALCVVAVTRQYIWNWPIGILSNVAFLVLFLEVGLYADAALQVVFAVLGVYGWAQWSKRRGEGRVISIRRARPREAFIAVALTLAVLVAVALLLAAGTDSQVPWPDASVLAFSLLATWGQAKKIIEQWWVWIAVDVVSVPLYLSKGLWLTAVLYLGFLALCVYGLVRWTRERRVTRGPATTEAPSVEVAA